jgi:hypothetical protein
MIAYQVIVNGTPVAIAGLKEGVLSIIANWVFVRSDVANNSDKDWNASIAIAGLSTSEVARIST